MGDELGQDSSPKTGKANAARMRFTRRFLGDRRGSTAVEFTMLAFPFALLVFAILESCISFAGQEVMANITDDIARQLRTGQLRQANISGTQLRDRICARLQIIVSEDCPNVLKVDLREFTTFAAAADAGFTVSGDTITLTGPDPTFQVQAGPPESKNMLRVFYPWPVITDFLRPYMSNMSNGKKTLHYASAVWQNEPFDE